jgi:hypothetical protein
MGGDAIIMRRKGAKLEPVTEVDRELLLLIPEGADITVRASRSRSPKQHRLFWSLLQLVVDNHDYYKRPEQLLEWMKVRLGYVEETIWHDGQVWFKTKSISFAAMGQDQFRQFFTMAVDLIVSEVIQGMDKDALLSEVSAMMGENVRQYVDPKPVDKARDRNSDRVGKEGAESHGNSRSAQR